MDTITQDHLALPVSLDLMLSRRALGVQFEMIVEDSAGEVLLCFQTGDVHGLSDLAQENPEVAEYLRTAIAPRTASVRW